MDEKKSREVCSDLSTLLCAQAQTLHPSLLAWVSSPPLKTLTAAEGRALLTWHISRLQELGWDSSG